MAQATFSCRCAAIHLETPILGFFRNYLPSRYPGFQGFSCFIRSLYSCGWAAGVSGLAVLPDFDGLCGAASEQSADLDSARSNFSCLLKQKS
jgi:hypothetical protein